MGGLTFASSTRSAGNTASEKVGKGWMTSSRTSSGVAARMARVTCWSHSPASGPSALQRGGGVGGPGLGQFQAGQQFAAADAEQVDAGSGWPNASRMTWMGYSLASAGTATEGGKAAEPTFAYAPASWPGVQLTFMRFALPFGWREKRCNLIC